MTDDNQPIDADYEESTQIVRHEPTNAVALFEGNPTKHLEQAEQVIKYMAAKCSGEPYVKKVDGKNYPCVEWWTTVGAALQCFPQEQRSRRIDHSDGSYAYEATVAVVRNGQAITQASAICRSDETINTRRGDVYERWQDEYAVKSMAATRATAKAYRLGFSFMAIMADLAPTPAEEMHEGMAGAGNSSNAGQQTQQRQPSQPQQPQQSTAAQRNNDDNPATCRVVEVLMNKASGEGAHGPWALHIIKTDAGDFATFDQDVATKASNAVGSTVSIGWKPGKKAGDRNAESIDVAHEPGVAEPSEPSAWNPGAWDSEVETCIDSVEFKGHRMFDGVQRNVWVVQAGDANYGLVDNQSMADALAKHVGTGEVVKLQYATKQTSSGRQAKEIVNFLPCDDDMPF